MIITSFYESPPKDHPPQEKDAYDEDLEQNLQRLGYTPDEIEALKKELRKPK